MVGTLTEWHLLPMMAPTAILRCIGRIDFDYCSASFYRFAGKLIKECRPRRVTDAFCEAMVMDHPIYMEVLHTDQTKLVDDPSGMLVGEVIAPELDPFMHTSYNLTMLASLSTAFCKLGVLALNFGKGFLFLAKETRVLDFLPIGEGCKGLEAHVNANLCRDIFQTERLTRA